MRRPARRGQACDRLRRALPDARRRLEEPMRAHRQVRRRRAGRKPPMTVNAQSGAALDAACIDIADLVARVIQNGPEPNYATEKLARAVFKAAEGLALC